MSDKLLHERLREYAAEYVIGDFACGAMKGISLLDDDALALAAEIERQYIPLPRFPDGEPVRLGCAVCGGIVGGFSVWDDGAFTTYDKDGNVLQDGDPGDFVKRPESKALDVDGVETKAGDTVWLHDKVDGGPVGEPMKVAEVLCDGTLVFEGGGAMPARLVTHREPDSLEKLRDDMREAMESSPDAMFMDSRWVDRLTALMERGER